MGYQRERDQFIARMTQEGLPLWAAERLLREATGINRRAELACSSEAADRDRVPCPAAVWEARHKSHGPIKPPPDKYPCLCDSSFNREEPGHNRITRITLQDWRAEERIRKMLVEINATIIDRARVAGVSPDIENTPIWHFQTEGDPRGYTLRVIPPSYAERNKGRDRCNRDSIGVPCRPSGIQW